MVKLFYVLIFFSVANVLSGITELDNANLKKNANAIILAETNRITFKAYDEYEQTYHRKIKILNKKAEGLQNVSIYYKKGSDDIKNIKITVFDGDGNKIKSVKSKDLTDYSSSDGFSMITDYRVKHWAYESNKYPFVIEYSYTKESSTTLSLPTWSPIPTYNVAVESSIYSLTTDQDVRIKELNFDRYTSVTKSDNTYKMVNQPALNKEKYSGPLLEMFPAVVFNPVTYSFEGIKGSFDTWSGYGGWIYKNFLANKKLENTSVIKNELEALMDPSDTKLEIAQKIYDFVQENTRYVSIALDEGGLNPMEPSKVHEVKYGDCKALSLYMHSLLELFDIESNYVEVHADSDFPIGLFEDYPSSFPGNHIILQLIIDGQTSWVDCTSSKNPFGYLGEFTDDRTVLCITEEGGTLTNTPALSKEENFNVETVLLSLDESGNGKANVSKQSHGYSISKDLWLKDLSDDDQEEYLKESLYSDLSIAKYSGFSVELDESTPSSNVVYDLELPAFAELAGDYTFISNKISPLRIPRLPKDGNRESDICFPRSFSQHSTLQIEGSIPFELIEVEPITFENEYGKYTKEISKVDDAIIVKRTFELNKNRYPKESYKKIKSFFDKCIKSDREPTTIKKL